MTNFLSELAYEFSCRRNTHYRFSVVPTEDFSDDSPKWRDRVGPRGPFSTSPMLCGVHNFDSSPDFILPRSDKLDVIVRLFQRAFQLQGSVGTTEVES
jgi:hypothetical protein